MSKYNEDDALKIHDLGPSYIGEAVDKMADHLRWAIERVAELEHSQVPKRIDADTPDGVLAWDGDVWAPIHRGSTGAWMHESTFYCDPQPTHYLPMPPAPVPEAFAQHAGEIAEHDGSQWNFEAATGADEKERDDS